MQVRILGPLEVWDDGRVVELGAGRQRALLALLALHPREIVATDRLIDELWGELASAYRFESPPEPRFTASPLARCRERSRPIPPGYRLRARRRRPRQHGGSSGSRRRGVVLVEDDPRRPRRRFERRSQLWRGVCARPTSPTRTSRSARSPPRRAPARSDRGSGRRRPGNWAERLSSSPSSRAWSWLTRFASGSAASSCSRSIEAVARRTLSTPTARVRRAAARGARARARSRASRARAGDPEPGSRARPAAETASARAPRAAADAPPSVRSWLLQ